MPKEVLWKKIKGFNGNYLISNKGEIYSNFTNRKLKGKIDKDGYREYALTLNGKIHYKRAHRLVAETFLPRKGTHVGEVVNHKDGNKLNNCCSNLEWCNVFYNSLHYLRNKKYSDSRKTISHLSDCEIKKIPHLYFNEGKSLSCIKDYFKLDSNNYEISCVVAGKRFSKITGITEDNRDSSIDRNPSYSYSDDFVFKVLDAYYNKKFNRKHIKDEFNVNDSWLSRVLSGKKRNNVYKEFMSNREGVLC